MRYKQSITPEEIDRMKPGAFPGKVIVIDKPGIEYLKAVLYLKSQKVIGFDTETRPIFTPGARHHGVSLLQLSGPDKAFLFRVQKVGLGKLLRKVLSDPHILKVGAATHDDVRGLQKIAPFTGQGFVDLQKIVQEWGIADKSVRKMAAIILRVRISKTQQLSNWEAPVLSDAQKRYASTDAWICREMYMRLINEQRHPLGRTPAARPQSAAETAQQPAETPAEGAPSRRRRRRRHHSKNHSSSGNVEGNS
ncbi:MAG: 3'-5' exonuclease domain-containing protein 2 [Bacteroidales bacterium]|nr:3'-5' exonuclease domain-containing protein 2 [Bacteroidales bacterium]